MTIRESTIAKLQQLPEPLLQQVSDFIDLLTDKQQPDTAINNFQSELAEVWARWFEAVDHLEISSTESVNDDYQQLLLSKYRQQGLEL